jgi:hypothetical protein
LWKKYKYKHGGRFNVKNHVLWRQLMNC